MIYLGREMGNPELICLVAISPTMVRSVCRCSGCGHVFLTFRVVCTECAFL